MGVACRGLSSSKKQIGAVRSVRVSFCFAQLTKAAETLFNAASVFEDSDLDSDEVRFFHGLPRFFFLPHHRFDGFNCFPVQSSPVQSSPVQSVTALVLRTAWRGRRRRVPCVCSASFVFLLCLHRCFLFYFTPRADFFRGRCTTRAPSPLFLLRTW